VIRRLAGVIVRPRHIFAELIREPAWIDTWLAILAVTALCAVTLLTSDVGQQAVVDERERVIETFGGTIDDAQHHVLLENPPYWVYFTSGSRTLLLPVVTLAAAAGCWLAARSASTPARFVQALSIVVHASVVLALGQLIAAPVHYGRESLTSPFNLGAVLPLVQEGTAAGRFFGVVDLFAVWWLGLIAVGLATLTGRPVRRYVISFAAMYAGFAAVMAGVIAALGGT
jgi:Yip1-like protein